MPHRADGSASGAPDGRIACCDAAALFQSAKMEETMILSDAARLALLAPRPGRLRAVLDTDTYNEIDDQFALAQAMLSPERIKLEAIYAAPFFNDRSSGPGEGMELSHGEILALLARLGVISEGLVYRGLTDYVGAAKQPLDAPAVDDLNPIMRDFVGKLRARAEG